MPARILVADDEPHIRDVVCAYLAREGYTPLVATNGAEALELARAEAPDLLVLDVMLPELSGFEVLRLLRAEGSGVGVLLLTARDDVIDRVAGLELGADDYMVKPFEPREVVARVGAILRRFSRPWGAGSNGVAHASDPNGAGGPGESGAAGHLNGGAAGESRAPGDVRAAAVSTSPPLDLFDLSIDLGRRDVSRRNERIQLTRTELDLLAFLAGQPGRVWTREQIGERVFGESFDAFDRTIDSHVKNLRRKLGARPDGGSYVETVRGIGYRAATTGEL